MAMSEVARVKHFVYFVGMGDRGVEGGEGTGDRGRDRKSVIILRKKYISKAVEEEV